MTKAALQTAYVVSEDLGTSLAERLFTSPRRHPRPAREQQVLATARESTVTITLRSPGAQVTTMRLATWRWGYGPPVLLVHGWEGRGSQLGAFVEPLVAAGLSVIAFDAPGHGDSPGHRLYLSDLADAIAGIADHLGPLHGIVAHSFGAAAVLLAHARDGVAVPRNVMVAPNAIAEDAVYRFARTLGLDDEERLALEQRLVAHTGVTFEALRLERLAGRRADALLVVHDRDDREVSFEHAERLAGAWPGAKLVATSGLGHRRILREPSVIAAAVGVVAEGIEPPASDLVREVDRQLAQR